MKRRRPPRPTGPSLVMQLANLRKLHPGLRADIEAGILVAEGWMRGSPLTRKYRVRIEYSPGRYPKAYVLEPVLKQRLPDQPVAHTNGLTEPCLFTREHGDWNQSMYVGQTIVPWLMEWLVFFEIWRVTGTWFGGGTLPEGYEVGGQRPGPSAA
jgi:hypothetical protein